MKSNFKTISKRDLIKTVSKRWNKTYKYKYCKSVGWDDKIEVSRKLKKLDLDTVDEKIITDIIGNNSWTSNRCDCCNKDYNTLLYLNYEEYFKYKVCRNCLSSGLEQLDNKIITDSIEKILTNKNK